MLIPPCCHTPVSASNVLLPERRGNVPQLWLMYSGLLCRMYVTSWSSLHSSWITCWDADIKRVPLHVSLLDAASFFQFVQVAWNAALNICINIQRKDCCESQGGSIHRSPPPCRGPLASLVQECVHHANAVMSPPPALSSSLESWWNVNINHVGHSTPARVEYLMLLLPNKAHSDGMEIKWKDSEEKCVLHFYRHTCTEVLLRSSSDFSLWFWAVLLTLWAPTDSTEEFGRHSSGGRRKVLYVEILWGGLVEGSEAGLSPEGIG